MPRHSGSCHCGDVRFEITSEIVELTTCDCSLCRKKNALMTKVHESAFVLHSDWSGLSLYRWNTQVALHYFCTRCGIYTFHRKRAQPDHFGINVFCLDGFDESSVPVRRTDGVSMSLRPEGRQASWSGPTTDR